jgi:hypothetical protein
VVTKQAVYVASRDMPAGRAAPGAETERQAALTAESAR